MARGYVKVCYVCALIVYTGFSGDPNAILRYRRGIKRSTCSAKPLVHAQESVPYEKQFNDEHVLHADEICIATDLRGTVQVS